MLLTLVRLAVCASAPVSLLAQRALRLPHLGVCPAGGTTGESRNGTRRPGLAAASLSTFCSTCPCVAREPWLLFCFLAQ